MKKYLLIFTSGLIEQLLFTLYLLAVSKYMIEVSTILMFVYFLIYLLIVKFCLDDKNSIKMLVTYALSASLGNYIAMGMHIIK